MRLTVVKNVQLRFVPFEIRKFSLKKKKNPQLGKRKILDINLSFLTCKDQLIVI